VHISKPDLSPLHRVLQTGGRRFSLKLEQGFWKTLEEEAKREGLVLPRFIQKISNDLPIDSSLTGFLRLYCLETLRARNQPLEGEQGVPVAKVLSDQRSRLISYFLSCPSAGLLLGPTQKVISVNPSFEKWSRVRSESIVGNPIDWHFQIRLPKPVSAVMVLFATGETQVISARVSYIAPGRIVVANAKVCLVFWRNPEDFIWSVMIDAPNSSPEPPGKAPLKGSPTPG
jgi:predicted DNA-binding ribbon-helix-helix protein